MVYRAHARTHARTHVYTLSMLSDTTMHTTWDDQVYDSMTATVDITVSPMFSNNTRSASHPRTSSFAQYNQLMSIKLHSIDGWIAKCLKYSIGLWTADGPTYSPTSKNTHLSGNDFLGSKLCIELGHLVLWACQQRGPCVSNGLAASTAVWACFATNDKATVGSQCERPSHVRTLVNIILLIKTKIQYRKCWLHAPATQSHA